MVSKQIPRFSHEKSLLQLVDPNIELGIFVSEIIVRGTPNGYTVVMLSFTKLEFKVVVVIFLNELVTVVVVGVVNLAVVFRRRLN